ncbi:hypothetical protein V491_05560 [Pseudogymnoascus sp. VKM F-3775]|nr:hypothetical protein V491_05560 [Pseudogymnoascus sp. VKM F-3775]
MHVIEFLKNLTFWEWYILLFWPYRYVRLIVNIIGHCLYRSIPKPENPTYTNEDVTVVIPTIESNLEELRGPISSILACSPHELILVTTFGKYHGLLQFAASFGDPRIKVYDTKIANKRVQLREAIPRVTTRITVLVDDDVTWPSTILPWLLAPFEREKMGSVGVCQRVQRIRTGDLATRAWNWLGACYIHRRNFEISASHFYDGGTSCMSGRTNAVRTEILKHPLFLDGFCRERWGKYHLNADDDNFLTRWLVNHDWKTWIQYERECEIETTLENDWSFVRQCLRWARSNWRSNYTTLFIERKVYWTQWWTIYALYFATFTSLGLITDPLYFYSFYCASRTWDQTSAWTGWSIVIAWYIFTKVVKLTGLLRRHPSDIIYVPVSVVFGFFHGFIKLKALWTWNETSWGNRPDGDIDNSERMAPTAVPADVMINPMPGTQSLVRYKDEVLISRVPSAVRLSKTHTYSEKEPLLLGVDDI